MARTLTFKGWGYPKTVGGSQFAEPYTVSRSYYSQMRSRGWDVVLFDIKRTDVPVYAWDNFTVTLNVGNNVASETVRQAIIQTLSQNYSRIELDLTADSGGNVLLGGGTEADDSGDFSLSGYFKKGIGDFGLYGVTVPVVFTVGVALVVLLLGGKIIGDILAPDPED